MAIGLEKKGGGRKKGLEFCTVQYRFITAGSYHEPAVMLPITVCLCYESAVMHSQGITNGS